MSRISDAESALRRGKYFPRRMSIAYAARRYRVFRRADAEKLDILLVQGKSYVFFDRERIPLEIQDTRFSALSASEER